MPHYMYLIIGGGMTADAAIGGIREVDPSGSIGLIGAEPHPPYDRPPLSKGLWKGKPLESIWRKTDRPRSDPPSRPASNGAGRTEQARHGRSGDGLYLSTSCSWPRAALRAGCPLAATTSSTTAHWTITSGCER